MTSTDWDKALEVTVAGVGTTFVILILLMLLVLVMKWFFATRFVQRKTEALATAEETDSRRERALAAAIAVSAAMVEDEATGRQGASRDTHPQ